MGIIFEEKASGTKRDGRTELQKVLGVLGDGDTLVVTRLDRLGRSCSSLEPSVVNRFSRTLGLRVCTDPRQSPQGRKIDASL